jgi:uncharacterized protein (DUF433 family)
MTADWIVSDPGVLGGKPCIRGTRISVEFILELFASGASHQDVLRAYPHIPPDGLVAAIEYAARALKNEVVWDIKLPA